MIRLYDADGTPQGPAQLVSAAYYDQYPAVAVLADGTFLVTWQGDDNTSNI